jgi:pre-mRNA-splicing factor ATP-dependent RNA helicase DHX38/PRP16
MLSKKSIQSIHKLPIYNYEEEIIHKLKNENILLLIGETGCGKTTQVPQILYNHNIHNNKTICITQPRRVAAISIALRVSQEVYKL